MVKKFEDIINEQNLDNCDILDLPAVHTTTEAPLFSILQSKLMEYPVMCDKYKERLVYFFYGKATYYTDDQMQNFSNDPPVCILFDTEEIKNAKLKRVLPFDSGGYDRYGIKKYNKEDFTINDPSPEICKKILFFLYGTKASYFNNNVAIENLGKKKKKCWPLQSLIELYNKNFGNDVKTGEQVFSIELQFEKNVEFKPSKLLLPYTFLSNDLIDLDEFKKDLPNTELFFYGEDEIIAKSGRPLTGFEYHSLMTKELKKIIC